MKKIHLTKNTTETMEPWRMLGCLLMIQVLVAFVGRSIAPLGILIGEDLSLTKAQIGMLPAALFLGQMIASIPGGILADRIESRKLLLVLSIFTGIGYMVMTLTSSFIFIIVLIIIGGLGHGLMHPTSNRGIIYWFNEEKRGTAMGIKQMGVTLGAAFSALLLLPLAELWGWRPALFIACIFLMMTGVVAFRFYYDPPVEARLNNSDGQGSFFTSLIKMFKYKPLLLVSICATGLNGSQIILNTYLVLFAYEKLGINLILSGFLLVISEVSGSFGRISWGIISDRLFNSNRLIILVIIASLTACISLLVAVLPFGTQFWTMVPITVVFGFCISGFNGIWMNVATELVPREEAGVASGFSIMIGSWGVILGPPLFGLIVDKTGVFSAGWLFITLIMIIVIVLLTYTTMYLKKMNRRKGKDI